MLELVAHRRLEVCGDDRPLVNAGAEKLVALVALDVEIELGPLDLGQPRRHNDGASRSGRRDMPHVDFITDCRVPSGSRGSKDRWHVIFMRPIIAGVANVPLPPTWLVSRSAFHAA